MTPRDASRPAGCGDCTRFAAPCLDAMERVPTSQIYRNPPIDPWSKGRFDAP